MEQYLFEISELIECQKDKNKETLLDNNELTIEDYRNIATALNFYQMSMESKLEDCITGKNDYAKLYKNYTTGLNKSIQASYIIWQKIINKIGKYVKENKEVKK